VRLDAVVEELHADHPTGAVMIVGEEGSGKTTALAHLAAVLENSGDVLFLDEPVLDDALGAAAGRFVVFTARSGGRIDGWTLRLLSWSRDELIEYLLTVHPESCRSVMQRLGSDWSQLTSSPLVWRIILDGLRVSPPESSPEDVLHRHVVERLEHCGATKLARSHCVARLLGQKQTAAKTWQQLEHASGVEVQRLLSVSCVQHTLAADQVLETMRTSRARKVLEYRWPYELVRVVAERLAPDHDVTETLRNNMRKGAKTLQPMSASLLVRIVPDWRPDGGSRIKGLAGGYLQGVGWSGANLHRAWLNVVDFSRANLENSKLDFAELRCARLCEAKLRGANLCFTSAEGADFTGADLSESMCEGANFWKARMNAARIDRVYLHAAQFREADLSEACFRGAVLERAVLENAQLKGTDFSDANLSGARLAGADLRQSILNGAVLTRAALPNANLEEVAWPDARLEQADLTGAHCTGSRFPDARMQRVNLFGAELGEIDWEGADLRGADLRGVSFHMGSARSGLLITPIASEGTRTGFYTDDCNEQHFKSPEEIRKANLCRADLRGAKIDGVDFYLVDLRGALYDVDQAEIFRKCGAILDADVDVP
jgi:uncharacterized protein YjbI with pentapeptide repeats/ABC-type cobalamin/Fe3+-siderophores transport system ATPase subunit